MPHSPSTLASALTPSAFNIGTAIGTGIVSAALLGPLGDLAPIVVGGVSAALALLSLVALSAVVRPKGLSAAAPA